MLLGTQCVNSKGHLEIGGCDTVELARRYGTPLYVLDEALVRENMRRYVNAFSKLYGDVEIAFAGKAFLTMAMCKIAEQEGLSLDIASGGELYTAQKAGYPAQKLFFHGNNKSVEELKYAIEAGVGRIVADNFLELERLDQLTREMDRKVNILIRSTPGIDPHTHRLISTGQADTKFGFNIEDGSAMAAVKKALECPNIVFKGVHCHIGSQLLDTADHEQAARIMSHLIRDILTETNVVVEQLNIGGGLGIRYLSTHEPPTIEFFAERICSVLLESLTAHKLIHPRLILEPGRSIVGEAGTTLYTVGTIKTVPVQDGDGYRTYAAVDGGLSDNPRPVMYDAVYEAIVANKADRPSTCTISIAGKHCETDVLIKDTCLSDVETGDIVAVQSTGAYNYSMASNYNRLTRPAAVLVKDGRADIIVQRESYEDLARNDVIPETLAAKAASKV